MRSNLIGLVVVVALLAPPTTGRAGGFTIPLIGARMAGQAAFVAHPDDSSAVYHNPAGLVLVEGLRFDVSGTNVFTNTAYTRADYPRLAGTEEFDTSRRPTGPCPAEGAATGYDPDGYVLEPCLRPRVQPKSGYGVLPFGGAAWNPGWRGMKNLAFGLAVYSPQNAQADFPIDGAQRYEVTSGAITTLYITPAVAWRPHRSLALGAGVSLIRASAQYQRAMWLPADLKRLNPDELLIDLDGGSWTAGYTFGLIWFPGQLVPRLKGLELGASYVSRAALSFDGTITASGVSDQLGPMLDGSFQSGQPIKRSATAEFTLPDMVRVGLGYDFGPRAWIGGDLYWSHYSLYKSLVIRLADPIGTIQEFRQDKYSHNSWSVGIGGRYSPRDWLDLRGGFFFDQSPYPNAYYTTLSPDADKYGFSTGLTLKPRRLWGAELSLAYMALFYADRVISDSKSRPEFGSLAPFSANGQVVDKVVHLLVVQLGWTIGAKR